jgi:hypothetical protein
LAGAISTALLITGIVLTLTAGPRVAGIDSTFAGMILVVVGAIGALVAFLLWSTGPRPSTRERRRGRHERSIGGR